MASFFLLVSSPIIITAAAAAAAATITAMSPLKRNRNMKNNNAVARTCLRDPAVPIINIYYFK